MKKEGPQGYVKLTLESSTSSMIGIGCEINITHIVGEVKIALLITLVRALEMEADDLAVAYDALNNSVEGAGVLS